jgi:phosphohistidine phosphatase SixA
MKSKILILIRHGIAIDGLDFEGTDFDRPLLKEGENEFRSLARFLKTNTQYTPEFIVTSSAKRCLKTAQILQEEYKLEDDVFFETRNLYYGD